MCVAPANAALTTHLIRTADPSRRAEINAALNNQNRLIGLMNIAVKVTVVGFTTSMATDPGYDLYQSHRLG